MIQRYREVTAEFPVSDLPPLETAYWLIKPRSLVRGTWPGPDAAAAWLGEQLGAYQARFTSEAHHDGHHLSALVTCAPNHARPNLRCPLHS